MKTSSPRDSQNGNAAQRAAALKGANLAFQKTLAAKSKPKPPAPSSRVNGALVAATSVTRDSPSASTPTKSRIAKQTTGSTINDEGYGYGHNQNEYGEVRSAGKRNSGRNNTGTGGSHREQQHNMLTPGRSSVATQSPSYIAATLAASRSTSPTPRNSSPSYLLQTPIRMRRRGSFGSASVASSAALDVEQPEADPMKPTTTLISMFEDKGKTGDPVKKSTPVRRAESPPKILSPIPKHNATPGSTLTSPGNFSSRLRPRTPPKRNLQAATSLSVEPRPRARPLLAQDDGPRRSHGKDLVTMNMELKLSPKVPLDIKAPKPQRIVSQQTITAYNKHLEDTIISEVEEPPRSTSASSSSSAGTFVSASSTHSPTRTTPLRQNLIRGPPPPRPPSRRSTAATVRQQLQPSPSRPTTPGRGSGGGGGGGGGGRTQQQPYPSRTPLYDTPSASLSTLPLPSLTDAMLASSLASVRAAQPSRGPSPVPEPSRKPHHRRGHSHSISSSFNRVRYHHSGPKGFVGYHHTGNSTASLPMPSSSPVQRSMPLTLRQDKIGDKANKHEAKKMKKRAKGSKRHAHSEGNRKRWRDEITMAERKRYEGLWASNKGLLVEYLWPPANDKEENGTNVGHENDPRECIINIVARDLWQRSRLPNDELAEVWELVDRNSTAWGGMLTKHEFVVGTWVVDQRLKGRKIPTKIQQSVWDSRHEHLRSQKDLEGGGGTDGANSREAMTPGYHGGFLIISTCGLATSRKGSRVCGIVYIASHRHEERRFGNVLGALCSAIKEENKQEQETAANKGAWLRIDYRGESTMVSPDVLYLREGIEYVGFQPQYPEET
ncbi:hypothetical protein MKZ38_006964 [Zalerion maritima]|uniref:EH domain-containing protein n=1 Tax=Zalerion maritima TaxID=339359 RepID=A0AAD5RJC5_9PEZI|nr:hypothetical protein MKZ38_006964 [Zalerion maritima]